MTACFIELFNVCYYFTYFSRMEKHKEKLDSLAICRLCGQKIKVYSNGYRNPKKVCDYGKILQEIC